MRLFPLLVAAGLALLFLWWFLRTPPQLVARRLRAGLLWMAGGLLIFLAASGRLPWLFALLGAAAPFVQRLFRLLQFMPLLQRLFGMAQRARSAQGPSSGQSSQVRTRFLHMRLDHDSGAMTGQVLEGRYSGRDLGQLSLDQLIELLDECSADEQSAAVLQAYLDRERDPDWRERAGPRPQPPPNTPGDMSRAEAYAILGLESDADEASILAAHRRLMQKLHPDRGGSTWLATRINRAKDLLLKA